MLGNTIEDILRDQKFKDGHRQIENFCSIENEKLKCYTLIETNIQGAPNTETKMAKNTQSYKVSEIGLHFRKFKSR